jgi:protein SCO1/2
MCLARLQLNCSTGIARTGKSLAAGLLAVALGLCLGACQRSSPATMSVFAATDATDAGSAQELDLTDHEDRPRTLADFGGRVVVVTFGYTHCPDFCPTTLADMARAMKLLGDDAARVQVLFVTLDPKRDTTALLAQYVPSFDPHFLALRGDALATAKAARSFGVDYKEQPGSAPDSYTLDHTAGSFVLDARGKLRLFLHYGTRPDQVAHDLRALLQATA